MLGSDKNISDAIFEKDDSWHSRILDDPDCKNTFKKKRTKALFKSIPQVLKGILRFLKLTGVDKLPMTPKLDLEKWGLGTAFFDVTIRRLGGVKFEDQCMTPKDRNMKRECQVTLVFPRLDLMGKVHWSRKRIFDLSWIPDGRYETSSNIRLSMLNRFMM